MNIHIYIFDDEETAIKRTLRFLEKYHDLADIHTFTSYERLEAYGDQISDADIAFIDIQFGCHTGFDVINFINKYSEKCIFTFFTNYSEYLKQGYEYRIYRYILKEEPDELICKQINETIEEYYKINKFMKISERNMDILISCQNIIYIESLDHKATFHMADGKTYKWNKSLNDILDKCLNNQFVRCHKAYIVNLSYIKYIMKKKKLYLTNGEQLDIGRVFKQDFFIKYDIYMKSIG